MAENRQEDDNGIAKVIKSMRQDREAEAKRDIGNRKVADRTLEEQKRTSQLLEFMLDGMNLDRQRSQDDKESGPAKKEDSKTDDKKDDKQSVGFLGVLGRILAGLSGAVLGLAYGIINTLTRPFRMVLSGVKDVIKKSNLVQGVKARMGSIIASIGNVFKGVTDFFKNLNPMRALRAGFAGETNKVIRGARGRFISLQKGITGFFASIGRLGDDLVKRFKRIQRALGTIPRVMSNVSVQTGKVGKFFKGLGDGMRTVGKFFQGFAQTFGRFFKVFAVIGRVIAFPITIITGLIGGIMQSFKDFGKSREEGDGIIKSLFKGLSGFIKGAINAIVMWPLDMVKGAVGWILGKLGFEGAENALAGFSFKGLFSSIWDWVTNFIADLPGMIVDTLVGAVKGIGNFFSNIDFGGFFGGIGDKVGEWWSGASDGFFKKFEHAKDTFGKLKGKVAGMQDKFRQFIMDKLPEKGSFLEKFVPDAVYEWVGQTGRFAPPKKDDAVDAPAKEQSKEELEQQLKSDKADLLAAEKALEDGTGSEMDVEEAKMFLQLTEMQLKGINELTKTNEEMNKARMEAIKTGDKQPLMEKKLEVASLEDRIPEGRAFTQAEIDAETDASTKEWMMWIDSPEGIEHQKKMLVQKQEREKQFAEQMAAAKLKREEENEKMMQRARVLRAERAEKAREVLATGMYKGKAITDEQRRQAELYIQRDEQTRAQAGAMVVAPQTNVTNNTSPTAVVAEMNMPVVDNLDRTYGT